MWVLQIDDDQDDLEIFGEAISLFDSNARYFGVQAVEEAFALYDNDDVEIPDVIFLDINMPRYSGFECYAMFKKDSRFVDTRFVFLSTSINQEEIPCGAGFMQKQNSLGMYVAMLEKVLPPRLENIQRLNGIRSIERLPVPLYHASALDCAQV